MEMSSVVDHQLPSPPRSPPRRRPRSPAKLTPLERKEHDRQLKKDQAQRRVQAIKDRDEQALLLQSTLHQSSQWHRQERQEEELVLRRLERDVVDVQRQHSATAGYRFSAFKHAIDYSKQSPVFVGYSPALCPPSQAPPLLNPKAPFSAQLHPAFTGHCIARHNDASAISPVFFFSRYEKIPLEEIQIEDSDEDEDEDDDAVQTQEQFLARQQGRSAATTASIATLNAVDKLALQALLQTRFSAGAGDECLVCDGRSAVGCPGCFEFNLREYQGVQSAKSTQRLKTPKTHTQEAAERDARYRGLRLKLMGYGRRSEDTGEDEVEEGENEEETEGEYPRPCTAQLRDYYVTVLADGHAVRRDRTVVRNYVALHIKRIPVGNLITLHVDVRSSIAYVYELYRSSLDTPNRRLHLLLPTTAGLFYLNEAVEDATDTRCGLVNGEFLVQDFRLVAAPASPLARRRQIPASSPRPPEFMLFSVAVLSDATTPQLVANFLHQNFHLGEDAPPTVPVEYAIARLPLTLAGDGFQQRLVPHVHRMKAFALMSKQLERLERERERERLLWVAYQERKLARLEHKKRQYALAQGDGRRSRKVTRAMAYLEFVLDATSNPRRPRVWEDRLDKLWQCAQLLEEWKLCKGGRLIDAENTADTRSLVQRLGEATVTAFDRAMERAAGSGPLLYPVQCIGSAGNARLVVRLGVRLGASDSENQEYGLILDLSQDCGTAEDDAQEQEQPGKKRGFTKKQLMIMSEEQARLKEAAASWRCGDCEWKPRVDSQATQLFTGSDLLRPPFLQFNWRRLVLAYRSVLLSLAFQLATLDQYNALARVLQQEDVIMGKAQIAKWASDVAAYQANLHALAGTTSPLLKTSAILKASQRTLEKKGAALLKQRLRRRKQQMRERELELERLQQLQEELGKPKLSLVQQLKQHFIQEKAPKINAVLEPTPAERLLQRAEQVMGVVAGKAVGVAEAAKKEYAVRTL